MRYEILVNKLGQYVLVVDDTVTVVSKKLYIVLDEIQNIEDPEDRLKLDKVKKEVGEIKSSDNENTDGIDRLINLFKL